MDQFTWRDISFGVFAGLAVMYIVAIQSYFTDCPLMYIPKIKYLI